MDGDDESKINENLYTIFIRFKVTTWVNDSALFIARIDASNYIKILLTSSNDLSLIHQGSGTSNSVTLTGSKVAANTEWIVRARGRVGEAALDDLGINLFNTSMESQEENEDDHDPVAFTGTLGANQIWLGNATATADGSITIYYVNIYNAWLNTDPCPW